MPSDDDLRPTKEPQPPYDNWPIAGHDRQQNEFLGLTEDRRPVMFDRNVGIAYVSDADESEETLLPDEDTIREVEDELGRAIEDIGDEFGWDSLSEFARDNLESEDDDA